MPGMLGVAVPWVLSFMICTLLAGRRLSVVRLSIAVSLSQALFHALFVLGSITPRGGFAPHVHGAALSLEGVSPLVPQDAGMWIAHGVAAALTIVALHRGERIVRALAAVASDVAAWLRHVIVVIKLAPVELPSGRRWASVFAPHPAVPHLTALRRRGPPLHLI